MLIQKNVEADITLSSNEVTIKSINKWYVRLWYLISNTFRYLFTGTIKF